MPSTNKQTNKQTTDDQDLQRKREIERTEIQSLYLIKAQSFKPMANTYSKRVYHTDQYNYARYLNLYHFNDILIPKFCARDLF